MSTYLVAMIVGDFVCRTGGSDGSGYEINALTPNRELAGVDKNPFVRIRPTKG